MSSDSLNELEQDEQKGRTRLILISAAVVVAVGLAIWSGIRSQAPPITVVGTLGADGRVKYYKDGEPTPGAAPAALPPSKE